jgi:hypothetical protein
MPDRSRCPNCGEHVSPYAAGCAVCGADLDFRRWDSGPGLGTRIGSWFSALSFGGQQRRVPGWVLWGLFLCSGSIIAAVVALFSGVFH